MLQMISGDHGLRPMSLLLDVWSALCRARPNDYTCLHNALIRIVGFVCNAINLACTLS